MNRQKINFLVDLGLGITFLIAFVSAFGGRNFREAHEMFGILSGIFALVHVIMHWAFIKAGAKNLFR